jgi:hypothetical protein
MDEVENFFCQFPNPWTLRVSGMGCYTSKCEKNSKSLHPTIHAVRYNFNMLTFNLLNVQYMLISVIIRFGLCLKLKANFTHTLPIFFVCS